MSDLMRISAAARAVGVSTQTLRDYEKRGLLKPIRIDGGMRLFERGAIEKLAAERARAIGEPNGRPQ